jgi:MFS family permease
LIRDRQHDVALLEPPLRARAERALDVLNFVLADVRYGLGPYAAIYLVTAHGWSASKIALAFTFGGIAGLVAQAPIGAMVDAVQAKRALLVSALAMVTGACLAIVLAPGFWPVATAGVAGALANSVLGTTLAAISLGIVGPARFARRAARNEALFHAGSGAVNLGVLAIAPSLGVAVVFWLLSTAAVASVVAALAIPAQAIDHDLARGFRHRGTAGRGRPSSMTALLTSRSLLVFAGCGALFHMANATMLGLVVQRAAVSDPAGAVPLAAASMVIAQAAMVVTASLAGARTDAWGRRAFFLVAFLALAVRGMLYTLSADPTWTVAVQVLDGIGVGVFGALFPVVVADLTNGAGHFNAAQGGVGTVHGIGGLIGGPLGAACVMWAGYDTAFLVLAAIAAVGAMAFWRLMPETHPRKPMPERGRGAGIGRAGAITPTPSRIRRRGQRSGVRTPTCD